MNVYDGPLRAYYEAEHGEMDEYARFIGKEKDGQLIGCVCISNWCGNDCEMGWLGVRGWLTKDFIKMVFRYVFETLGCTRATGRIDEDNHVAISQAEKLGFVLEGRIREACPAGDVLIYGLLKRDCKFYG